MAELHVSIAAEKIASIGPLTITNSLFTGFFVTIFLVAIALYFSTIELKKKNIGIFQNIIELIVESIFNLSKDIAGNKKARDFLPLILTAMLFILFNNWLGLVPGVGTIGVSHPIEIAQTTPVMAATEIPDESLTEEGLIEEGVLEEDHGDEKAEFIPVFRAATADLNTTIALALISVLLTQYYGIKYLGLSYFTKFFNFKQGPIFTAVGFLEIVSEFAKIISFAFRLFGNIFAGEVLLTVIAFLLPVLAPIPFLGLEIFVGLIQALVFGMLTLVFINMATTSHDH